MRLRERVALAAAIRAEQARRSGLRWCPHRPTEAQRRFLALDTLEALYGGAAGGGKSDALLMCALRYADAPGAGLILRRTLSDLALPGALMDRAHQWLQGTSATWSERDKRWTFPSGFKLTFGYCETPVDVYRYQGSEYQVICVDELTQWPEEPYRYLLSRLRRIQGSEVPIRMRAATNPGGLGHAWVKGRFVEPGSAERPFVPAKLDDNPHLDRQAYEAALSQLDDVTRDQLRRGLWVQATNGRVYAFDRDRHLEHVDTSTGWRLILGLDLGASESKPTTGFALVAWHEHDPRTVVVRSWVEAGMTPSSCAEVVRFVQEQYPDVRVIMDEGALGRGYGNELRQRYGLPVVAAQKRDKLGYRKLLNGAFQRNEVVLTPCACDALVDELEGLVWDARGLDAMPGLPDHASDALLYAWREAHSYRATPQSVRLQPHTEAWWANQEREREERERLEHEERKKDHWWG